MAYMSTKHFVCFLFNIVSVINIVAANFIATWKSSRIPDINFAPINIAVRLSESSNLRNRWLDNSQIATNELALYLSQFTSVLNLGSLLTTSELNKLFSGNIVPKIDELWQN